MSTSSMNSKGKVTDIVEVQHRKEIYRSCAWMMLTAWTYSRSHLSRWKTYMNIHTNRGITVFLKNTLKTVHFIFRKKNLGVVRISEERERLAFHFVSFWQNFIMNFKKVHLSYTIYVLLNGSTGLSPPTKLTIIYLNYRIKGLNLVAVHICLNSLIPHLSTKSILVPFVLHMALGPPRKIYYKSGPENISGT